METKVRGFFLVVLTPADLWYNAAATWAAMWRFCDGVVGVAAGIEYSSRLTNVAQCTFSQQICGDKVSISTITKVWRMFVLCYLLCYTQITWTTIHVSMFCEVVNDICMDQVIPVVPIGWSVTIDLRQVYSFWQTARPFISVSTSGLNWMKWCNIWGLAQHQNRQW